MLSDKVMLILGFFAQAKGISEWLGSMLLDGRFDKSGF